MLEQVGKTAIAIATAGAAASLTPVAAMAIAGVATTAAAIGAAIVRSRHARTA